MTGNEFPAHNEVMELLYGKPARKYLPDIISILSNIEGLHDENLPLLKRLLTSGSAKARQEVRDVFLHTATNFQMAYDSVEKGNWSDYAKDDEESQWERFLDGHEHPVIQNKLLGVWNAANVVDETGTDVTVRDTIAGMGTMPFIVEEIDPDHDKNADSDPYWRGLAAVAISRHGNPSIVTMDREVLSDTVTGFIEWAGTHDDITKVIDVARERGSFDRRLLEEILAEQGEKTALSSGVL
jgi:hypothetical protein